MSEYRYREKSKVQALGSFNIQRFGKANPAEVTVKGEEKENC